MRRIDWARGLFAAAIVSSLLAILSPSPVSAASAGNSNPNNYLALGDSVTFGYNPIVVQPGVNPDVFVGYPQLAAALFRPKLKVANASCPGETSTSLITGTRPDNGCQDYRQFIGALHVDYPGSQLQYAKRYVAANPRTKLVSLMIGANDLLILQHACEQTAPASATTCISNGLPTLLTQLQANVTRIYRTLRHVGFTGDFLAITYYSLNYNDPLTAAINAVNNVLVTVTQAFHGEVADGFSAFAQASIGSGGDSCAAGLLIHLTPDSCDVHPSPAGAALLASTVRSAVNASWH